MSEHKRPGWDAYFMGIAREVATRGTCDRLRVGAVIVRTEGDPRDDYSYNAAGRRVDMRGARAGHIIATGYNGAPRGLPHCDDVGHEMEHGHCVRVIHSEVNALLQAARIGSAVNGAVLYCTASPCYNCAKQVAQAGIARVVYGAAYRDQQHLALLSQLSIQVEVLS